MTALWTHDTAAAATGGSSRAVWTATGVSIDSRSVAAGDLFVAIVGPNADGHRYVADALARGAAAAVVARDALPGLDLPDTAPLLVVSDTFRALEDLARAARARSRARIVGITGSVGKTGTKEALGRALSRLGPTTVAEGNLNNHWGLPLSLARMPAEAAYGVFELGMNHAGEIAALTGILMPHVAVVTKVAAAHAAHFASEEAIADAKGEIFRGVVPGGAAVVNRDNPHFARLVTHARAAGIHRILGFGQDEAADIRLLDCTLHAACSAVRARIGPTVLDYSVGAPGRHIVQNSLAVLGAVHALGGDLAAAARAMGDVRPLPGRGIRHRVETPRGAFLVIDESYNANPTSMRAAIAVLGTAERQQGGRRIAVIGDMLELGPDSAALHAALAPDLKRAGVDLVFTAGMDAGRLFDALPAACRGSHAADSATLAPLVAAAVRPGDTVMIKGSAGSRMGRVLDALMALADTHRGAPAQRLLANGG